METTKIEKTDVTIVNYITDRETFFRMKDVQKAIAEELKSGKLHEKYLKDIEDWLSKEPVKVPMYKKVLCNLGCYHDTPNECYGNYKKALDEWQVKRPDYNNKIYNSEYARHFNIVYSMIRGRSYKEIEPKVRKNNGPSTYSIKSILKEYNLDANYFFNEKGGLK